MYLERLESSLPGLADLRMSPAAAVDWAEVEEKLGFIFPEDYKSLVSSYRKFIISGLLSVLAPRAGAEESYVSSVRNMLEFLEIDGFDYEDSPAPFPEEGGLFPWGSSNSGDTYYWEVLEGRAIGVVTQNRDWEFWTYRGSMTEFLADWSAGEITPEGQPDLNDWGGARAKAV